MQKCGFTFRADNGTPTFELSSQPAIPMALKFDLGAIAGAPKGKRPINHPKSRASRALALQLKDDTSFAATTANSKFGFSAESSATAIASTLLVFGVPAPEKTIDSKTRLSRFQENLNIPQQTRLAAEIKDPMDDPLPASISSRRDINEKYNLCLSQ